jgi:hypothetical protein
MSERAPENVLVVVLEEHPDLPAVRGALGRGGDTRVRLVAPAHVGPLHWYATDEDEERADAEARAGVEAAVVARAPDVEVVEAGAGEADPVLAVEDALSDFPADRIVVVGEEDAALDSSLRRFSIPVEHLGKQAPGGGAHETGRAIMSGRSAATPYAVFGGAMVVLGTVVALLLLLAALILWL